MKSTKGFLIVLIALAFAIFLNHPAFGGDTYYVPDDFPTIQDAIDATFGGDTIIVRAGTYTGEGNKNITIDGKVISVESESGPENTIIDCEGAERGFYLKSLGSFTKLDGFKIINGSASNGAGIFCDLSSPSITNCIISGNTASSKGGGIYCSSSSPSITNCTFSGNTASIGGGICCSSSSSSPSITNCTFSGNTASSNGGGIYCSSSSITNCTISGNTASSGGGIYCSSSSSPSITNCAISGNSASSNGGGIYCYYSSPSITNCTISGNTASSSGGGIYCQSSSPSITNSILYFDSPYEIYGSPTVTYSDIMGGYEGEGNIDKLPSFIGGGDYHLEGNSPCIDAGTSEGAPDTDIDGELRPQGAGYDMGADECDGVPPPPACKGDFDNDGDVDGSDLAVSAAEFGRTDCPCER